MEFGDGQNKYFTHVIALPLPTFFFFFTFAKHIIVGRLFQQLTSVHRYNAFTHSFTLLYIILFFFYVSHNKIAYIRSTHPSMTDSHVPPTYIHSTQYSGFFPSGVSVCVCAHAPAFYVCWLVCFIFFLIHTSH